jgi:two-component system nitrogen regulation sensor histidine kinase NtrY
MLLVIVLSLTGTMYVAWQFATNQEEAYNAQRLLRKEASVERSLEYTLDRLPHTLETEDIPAAFSDRICELADIHGMDIALYHPNGRLLTQSTLNEGNGAEIELSNELLDALDGATDRIQGVDFGESVKVYWNVLDQRQRMLGIVGVRYQKRALESGGFRAFWSQLAPLYIVLFLGGAMLAVLLSNGLVKDLRVIRDRMRALEPGKDESPIEYHRSDAIGELVEQYNALLKQLKLAVEELAKQEREGAWRMMAMQVAHEIKNPLTPIKLGAQQLERAWMDQRPDFGDRLKRHCRVVSEQIDVLSDIAQDFSMLAAVGLNELETIDVEKTLRESLSLYESANPHIGWEFHSTVGATAIKASQPHLIRAFNNLISNAVDAVSDAANPQIKLTLFTEDNAVKINVSDNGVGIPPDRLADIFQPRFTLKRTGTGLGLTITQSIVNQLNGAISVSSIHGKGSDFTLSFPGV